MSNHLQLAGNVAVDELDRLRRVNAQLDEALRQTRNEFSQMRMERDAMMQAVSGLRRLLAPLWGELQDLPAATADAPVRESASRWEAAKRRLGGKSAMFIDLMIEHGPMTITNFVTLGRCSKLSQAGIVQNISGRYSLKEN
jgi:hypothetical protein